MRCECNVTIKPTKSNYAQKHISRCRHIALQANFLSNKIFSGDQPREMNKRNRRFEDHLGLHHQGCDLIPEAPWAPVSHHIHVDEDRDGPRNVGFFYSSHAADRPRRFYWIRSLLVVRCGDSNHQTGLILRDGLQELCTGQSRGAGVSNSATISEGNKFILKSSSAQFMALSFLLKHWWPCEAEARLNNI
jgi:hypothetical protein